jgi:hypothetical protein
MEGAAWVGSASYTITSALQRIAAVARPAWTAANTRFGIGDGLVISLDVESGTSVFGGGRACAGKGQGRAEGARDEEADFAERDGQAVNDLVDIRKQETKITEEE